MLVARASTSAAGVRSAAAPLRAVVARPALRLRQAPKQQQRSVVVRAEAEADVDKLVKDLADKWEKVENKTGFVLYSAGAFLAVWFSSTLVTALNSIPLLPKFMELVGLGYTSWFVYRYLLFKSSREELVKDVDDLKKKITGEL